MPTFIKPMLAKLVDAPFDGLEWIFEIKWDGYRALAFLDKDVHLFSRSGQSFKIFAPILEELSLIKRKAIFDGEVVILDKNGKSDFQLIQNYQRSGNGHLVYFVFDLLFLDGKDLRQLPLIERKGFLQNLLKEVNLPSIKYSDHIENRGIAFFKKAADKGLEGIMAKEKESLYLSRRSSSWLKIKTKMRQEAIIVGYTAPRGTRRYIGSLILGAYDKGKLIYIGLVGGGFNTKLLADTYAQLQPLVQKKSPFATPPKLKMAPTWVKPKLVCEVAFAEWTQDGRLRQPIFKGMRIDKKATDVKRERPISIL